MDDTKNIKSKASARRIALILAEVDDIVGSLLYYDRKEDEELGRGEIERSIDAGEITADEIADAFTRHLRLCLGPKRGAADPDPEQPQQACQRCGEEMKL